LRSETQPGAVDSQTVDPQTVASSENQLHASSVARDAAKASLAKAQAELESRQAALQENEFAVKVATQAAQAHLQIACSESNRALGSPGDLKLYAPFDGVVLSRNFGNGEFVMPAAGDMAADGREENGSVCGAAPACVIGRADVVRVFVDVPEHDARFVEVGTKATVLAETFCDQPIVATVTRILQSPSGKSGAVRAEIDLPNNVCGIPADLPLEEREALALVKMPPTDNQILPGMYAHGEVIIERPHVLTLPFSALSYVGNKVYCWSSEHGKAVRTEVQTGVTDGQYVEVLSHRQQRPQSASASSNLADQPADEVVARLDNGAAWSPFTGGEEVILGDVSSLTDGAPVQILTAVRDQEAHNQEAHGADTEMARVPTRPLH